MADDPVLATLDAWAEIEREVDELAAKIGNERRTAELAGGAPSLGVDLTPPA